MDQHSSTAVHTRLTADFPELAHLSREDLEDLLADQQYFQAVFHTLPQVKLLYQGQADLGSANESIASTSLPPPSPWSRLMVPENNIALQDNLYRLRSETQDAFDRAKQLEARWKEVEKEQREVYQRFDPQFMLMRLRHATTAQDDLSEARANAFVQGSVADPGDVPVTNKDIDDFVKEFRELRKTYHKRVMWGDRWQAGEVVWRDD
uniref:AAA domain-containing protein n=1 Tax=Ganoderma boninense TaxID=34458 RepID=A0A5K1K589_9APHY|nr:AAA domain-containing protein [Ganoderma boninense]